MRTRHLLGAVAGATALFLLPPSVARAAGTPVAPTVVEDDATYTIGSAGKVTFVEPVGSPVPSFFVYETGNGAITKITANKRRVTVSIVPTSPVNGLQVWAVEADGTFTPTTTTFVHAVYPPPFADQDLTGDGKPDLLTVGGATGLPPGVWLTAGKAGKGRLRTPATLIASVDGWPAPDFDGAQTLSGTFTGTSFNDLFVYYPSGLNAGLSMIASSFDNGGPVDEAGASAMPSGTMSDLNGDNPTQVANAYDSAGTHNAYPDLFAVNGDRTNGYTLDYYPNSDGTGAYFTANPTPLPTPTGGTDWNSWHLASKLLPNGTALLLSNPTTGALYLWESVTYDGTTLRYTSYRLAATWPAAAAALQLSQDASGAPLIWAVSSGGAATAYLVSHLSTTGTATLKAQPTQPLLLP